MTSDENNLIENVLEQFPALRPVTKAETIEEYMSPIMDWVPQEGVFPYRNRLLQLISEKTEQLYGQETALQLVEQLKNKAWLAETGPHAHLPRDLDRMGKVSEAHQNINTLIVQSIVAVTALHAKRKLDYKLSLYTGIIPSNNANSGAYFQPSSDNIKTVRLVSNKFKDVLQSFSPKLSNETITAHQFAAQKLDLKPKDKERTEKVFDIFNSQSEFVDQLSVSASCLYNELTKDSGCAQVTLDLYNLSILFLTDLLKDENSFISQVFQNDDKAKDFAERFAGMNTGWKQGQTPFINLKMVEQGEDKYYEPKGNYEGSCDRQTLLDKIEKREISPTGALCFSALMIEGGLLAVGGMFQAEYCTQIRDRAVSLLNEMGDTVRAQSLSEMPTKIAVLTPVWGLQENGDLMNYGAMLEKAPLPQLMMNNILSISGQASLYGAAPCLLTLAKMPCDMNEWQQGLKKYHLICG